MINIENKFRGEPTVGIPPDFVSRPESYTRDMIYCLSWYGFNTEHNKMRSVCEQHVGRSLKHASNNDLSQLGALIRMKEQGAVFSEEHNQRFADMIRTLIENEEQRQPVVNKPKAVRVDQAKIALAQVDGAIDDFITNDVPFSVESILSQFSFTREEKSAIHSFLKRKNEQFKESVSSKCVDVKQSWSHISLKKRKMLVEATRLGATKQRSKEVETGKIGDASQVIAVNEKHGVVQVINGNSLKKNGKSITGFDQKKSYMVRASGVKASSTKAEVQKMIKTGARVNRVVTGRLGQLWVIV